MPFFTYSKSLNDSMRNLDFLQWMDMLEKVFNNSLNVLRRMQVKCCPESVVFRPLVQGKSDFHVKMTGSLSKIFEKFPKRYQNLVWWTWLK